MNLIDLVDEKLISITDTFSSPEEAINHLTQKLCDAGKINDRALFVEAVLHRAQEGPTALGESLAVPHGKSDAVSDPCFALAVLKKPVMWSGIDEDESVQIIVLLGIPLEHQGDTHIALLSELTGLLMDDDFRQSLKSSMTPNEIVQKLSHVTA